MLAACVKFVGAIKPGNPLYALIHNRYVSHESSISLISARTESELPTRTDRFRNFVTVKYAKDAKYTIICKQFYAPFYTYECIVIRFP